MERMFMDTFVYGESIEKFRMSLWLVGELLHHPSCCDLVSWPHQNSVRVA